MSIHLGVRIKKLGRAQALKLRFLMVGGLNTLIGIICFPLMYYLLPFLQSYYLILMLLSQVFCISFSYITNKYLVFKTKQVSLREYLRFTFFYNFVFLINLGVLPLLVKYQHLNPAIVQLCINIFIAVASYFWHTHITFPTSTREKTR